MSALEPHGASAAVSSDAAGYLTAPSLYAIADGDVLGLAGRGPQRVIDAVAAMADAGVRWIQLRLKHADDRTRHQIAAACRRRLEGMQTALWIDDRADLARLVDAQGVHLGQHDLSPAAARLVVGEQTWIGLSCHDLAQVAAADADANVDVVAIGPVFATRSKQNADPEIGIAGVAAARRVTEKTLVAIGGLDQDNAGEVLEAGADSVVMLGAFCRGDIATNSRRLVRAIGGETTRMARALRVATKNRRMEVAG